MNIDVLQRLHRYSAFTEQDVDIHDAVAADWNPAVLPRPTAVIVKESLPPAVAAPQAKSSGAVKPAWCHPLEVVCAAFVRRPTVEALNVSMQSRRPLPVHHALHFGLPFMIWPDGDDCAVDDLRGVLQAAHRPEHLCHCARQREPSFTVLAECEYAPFPEAGMLRSPVRRGP